MIFAIVFVFVFDINIASATTATFGYIYGTELGSEILAFVLASLAVGVTYNSLVEVEQLFKASEPINWDEILGSAPDPPPGGGNNPNKKLITALLLGVPGGAFLSSIFGDLISWFQGLGSNVGENSIDIIKSSFQLGNNTIDLVKIEDNKWRIDLNGNLLVVLPETKNNDMQIISISPIDQSNVYINISFTWRYGGKQTQQLSASIPGHGLETEIQGSESIKYNVKPNSSVITNIPPTTIPQPDISMLPGIETITTPDGQEKVIYPGDFEDLVDEIVNNITFDDVKNITPGSNPYIVTETQQGLNIDIGVESPFPDVNTDPIEDTSAYQGTTIGLLQSIINWLSLIRNDISSLPEKLFEVPQDLSLNFDNLRLNGFQERFPFSIPWDIASAIGVFSSSPTEPDLTIDMDTNYFSLNHEIDISAISLPLRFARYAASVFFVLYLANKTRDLIKW